MFSSNQSNAAAAAAVNYIEDVFSCFLYTGNGATQTITNGIDLSGKGGLVWVKDRSTTGFNRLYDTIRGTSSQLYSNATNAAGTQAELSSFNSNGFTLTSLDGNLSPQIYASWTFREQPKFFDIVTWTGNGTTQNIPHSLGATPGCIIVKNVSSANGWQTWHRGLTSGYRILLNSTSVETNVAIASVFGNNSTYVAPTSTQFTVGNESAVNENGQTMVAYLFAHDAGGFGLAGTDNVISCGSLTGAGGGVARTVTLGYEPQFLLVKRTDAAQNWYIFDNMRGLVNGSGDAYLSPNLSAAEVTGQPSSGWFTPTATGFIYGPDNFMGDTANIIYIAIRRGPMAVPTLGTSVFGLNARTGTGANATVTGSAGVSDAVLVKNRGSAIASLFSSRLTSTGYVVTSTTAAEVAAGTTILQASPWDVMDGVKVGTTSTITNSSGNTFINYLFKRAPSFFDEVCYTGTGSTRTVTHNLSATPELVITKSRSQALGWVVWTTSLTNTNYWIRLDDTMAQANSPVGYGGTFSASNYTIANTGPYSALNNSGSTYVAYLFATCAGVSKVGSYTGTGTTLQIDCGFTAGARFVLIKRTDSTGDWYVWDTARGIIAGNDPYLLLNSTAAEVTSTDYIDTYSAGFEISSTAPAAINASAGTFVFLAIA